MNTNISMFVICVEAIIYLLFYNFHDCTFKLDKQLYFTKQRKSKLPQSLFDLLKSVLSAEISIFTPEYLY